MKPRVDYALCGFDATVRLFGFDDAFGNAVPPESDFVQGNPKFGCCPFLEKP